MPTDPVNQTRYRALRGGLLLVAGVCVGGFAVVVQLPQAQPFEWILFLVVGIGAVLLVPVAARARDRGDRATLEFMARAIIVVGALLLLQRVAFGMYGPLIHDRSLYLFRASYSFLPFLYLAAFAVMRAREAVRACWLIWAAVLALTVPALVLNVGFDPERYGFIMLLMWLLLANPLFILTMGALPHYEDTLDRRNAELAEMRERTELMDKLEESERRFDLVVDGLEVGVWDRWVGPPERRWWSPRFYELLGYAPGELDPTEPNLRDLMHPDDRETVWKAGSEQLRKGTLLDVDFRFQTKHRGYRWFNSRARAERDADGKLVRLAGSLTDIHDRRMAEDRLHAAQVELTRLAYRDTLTDLHNRRYFDEHFQREWERARRSRQPLSLLLVDLDHFKAYNDRYGHAAGDSCLVEFAHLMARCANRPADIVARLGGEEFGLVLPETSALRASRVAQRMQLLLEQAAIPHEGSASRILTFSTGIAAIETPDGPGPAELFEQADRALYEIKRRGRNGILRYDELAPGEALFGTKAR
jgi:diguanylate cyclase (GGDEF)-like protein/PAS domain S-box-containing protein